MSSIIEIDGFESINEFERFMHYINDEIINKELIEIPAKTAYFPNSDLSKNERWFIDTTDDIIWRLVPPDFPFEGFFKRVDYF